MPLPGLVRRGGASGVANVGLRPIVLDCHPERSEGPPYLVRPSTGVPRFARDDTSHVTTRTTHMSPQFWRKWHRWFPFTASVLLLFAAVTGIIVAFTECFGEAERLREATRDLVSPVNVQSPAAAWSEPVAKALAAVNQQAPGAPVDKMELQFKGDEPTV